MPIMDHFSVAVFPWGRKPPTMTKVVEAAQYAENSASTPSTSP